MIPVTIIGGYLGAGKTTLINQMLRQADGLRIAVMVNDFGELPIDASLIEGRDGDVISLAGGCICCAFGDNLAGSIADLIDRAPPPDHIVIETSGVAVPGATLANLTLLSGIRPEGSVVLVDAETVERQAKDRYVGDTVLRQIGDAGLIVITKTDLVASPKLAHLDQWLATINADAGYITASHGHVPNALLLGEISKPIATNDMHDTQTEFETIVIEPIGHSTEELGATLALPELGVIRAKGFFRDHNGQTHLMQLVGRRWKCDVQTNTYPYGIVCIGIAGHLNRERLTSL